MYVRSSQEIRRRSRELAAALAETERTYDATLSALSSALDVRDSETDGHARRVVQYPPALGPTLAVRLAEVLERASGQPVQPAAPQLKGTDLGLRRPRGCSSAVAMFQSLCTGRAYS